ncbi:MAG TPA: 50S ribosomal protein L11 methyltransferase [Bacteroidota bacterium]|nr:50S ribosomal protein L11 methyltransferase [Bacteroidota bacterium]
MNTTYYDCFISLVVTDEVRDLLPALFNELGFEGFVEEPNGFHCYITQDLYTDDVKQQLADILNTVFHAPDALASVTELKERNWNEEWERTIKPIWVTESLVIAPTWEPVEEAEGRTVIVIDPKMSFGTGYHETTRLMLRMMQTHMPVRTTVLDVGTGTGVLAIAAVKLGACSAIGVDIDEWSADNGNENIERNKLQGSVEIRIGSLDVVPESAFDVILANILRSTIIELLPGMCAKLGSGGMLFLSGLLTEDQAPVESALKAQACTVVEVIRENEWIGITARKNG